MNTRLKILIADDHEIVRSGLSAVFGYQSDFSVIGEATNGREAITKALQLKPDIVIMDLMMPIVDGAQATQEIIANNPSIKVVILTTFAASADIIQAIEHGASGAISKDSPNTVLLDGIRRVAAGEQFISPDISDLMNAEEMPTLSPRQTEVLHHLSRGITSREIATILGISEDGVKFHIRAIFAKLGAANRAEAIATAMRRHLLKT